MSLADDIRVIRLPEVAADLSDLSDDPGEWHRWPHWSSGGTAVVRRVDDERWVAVIPFIFTHAIVWGWMRTATSFYEDRWCYHSPRDAIAAATVWDVAPGTEPEGWHRHPMSGRRNPPDPYGD